MFPVLIQATQRRPCSGMPDWALLQEGLRPEEQAVKLKRQAVRGWPEGDIRSSDHYIILLLTYCHTEGQLGLTDESTGT